MPSCDKHVNQDVTAVFGFATTTFPDPIFHEKTDGNLENDIKTRLGGHFSHFHSHGLFTPPMRNKRADARKRRRDPPAAACGTPNARPIMSRPRGSERAGGGAAKPANGLGHAWFRRPAVDVGGRRRRAADGNCAAGGGALGGAAPAKGVGTRAPSAGGSQRVACGQEHAKRGEKRGGERKSRG